MGGYLEREILRYLQYGGPRAWEELKKYLTNMEDGSKELAAIIMKHAAASAVAGMLGGVIPGVAALIAVLTSGAAVWVMYFRIGLYLHLGFNIDILKAIVTAVVVNIVTQLGGVIVAELVMSFIPGLSILVTGICIFGVTCIAGLMFVKALIHIFGAGKDPTKMSSDELKEAIKDAGRDMNMGDIFSDAESVFKKMHKDGTLNEQAKGVDISGDNLA